MHNLGVAVLLISYVLYVSSTPAKYTTRFDNLDIDQILKSDRLLKHYVECLMDRGPCTPEGSELRSKYKKKISFINLRVFSIRGCSKMVKDNSGINF